MTVVFGVLILMVLASLVLLGLSVRVVREYRRLVVFRLGRVIGLRNPGVRLLIPVVDRPVSVDLREFYLESASDVVGGAGARRATGHPSLLDDASPGPAMVDRCAGSGGP